MLNNCTQRNVLSPTKVTNVLELLAEMFLLEQSIKFKYNNKNVKKILTEDLRFWRDYTDD